MARKPPVLLVVALIVAMALGFACQPDLVHFAWEKLPVFDTLYGIVGSLALIFGAKALRRFLIQRGEDYYD